MISALNRKLFRDLLLMKGQALAIALVVGAGVSMFVMYLSNFDSLRRTQQSYYARQKFGDVFASLTRAPRSLEPRIAAITGVAAMETRVVAPVNLDVPGLDEPATALLLSLDANRRPAVNEPYLRRGRWLDVAHPDDVLASEKFVAANRMTLGSRVGAVVNGRLRQLTIVGIALSPEHVYSIRPGEIIPDNRRFATIWMERRALAAAFDMEGGFNDVALTLSPGASIDAAIADLDRLLDPYGGRGAIPRTLQPSHWMLESELDQLQTFGFILPLLFLIVAAFILNVAMTRALALQRPQIAALKALGYGNSALAWHYAKWAMMIAAAGIVLGVTAGNWLGHVIIGLYNEFFQFPELLYRLPGRVVLGATAMTLLAATLGAYSAVRHAVRIPPAEAMRAEPPARYRRSIFESAFVSRHLGNASRMVLRNISRHPLRSSASIIGIALAVSILVVGFVFTDAMEELIATQFSVTERQDISVTFIDPRDARAVHALSRLPGVRVVEAQRSVPARIRAGHRHRNVTLEGRSPDARLRRIVDARGHAINAPVTGIVMSTLLARTLGVGVGDTVAVEMLEGRRDIHQVHVAALVDDVIGLAVYMDITALRRLLREGDVSSGASLLVDANEEARLISRVKALPGVAGTSVKRAVLRNFRETLTANMNLSIFINIVFAAIIACGVVYNAARVSLSERSRELASLRVLGFRRGEISVILLGELALLTLVALPLGAALGYVMATAIAKALDSEVYRFPLVVSRDAVAAAFLTVIGATAASGLLVRRQLDRLDLVAVLKIRE